MSTETLPGHPSDAGPDTQGTPMDWEDYIYDAEDSLQTCRRLPRAGCSMDAQMMILDQAIESLNRAKELIRGAKATA